MIKNKTILNGLAAVVMAAFVQGCWHEDLSECEENVVKLTLGLERLPGSTENPDFATEVDRARYFIFNDSLNTLSAQGMVDVSKADGPVCDMSVHDLPLGKYTMVVVANDNKWTTDNISPSMPEEITVANGAGGDKSSYVKRYSFTHECECGFSDYVTLYRTDALVKLRLLNIPEYIKGGNITVTNVAETCLPDSLFSGSTNMDVMFDKEEEKDCNIEKWFSVFPSADESGSYVWLNISVDNGDSLETILERVGRLWLKRNSINEIIVNFNSGNPFSPEITIEVDKEWDGTDDIIFDI